MKRNILLPLLFLFLPILAHAQQRYLKVPVSYYKNVNLIFSHSIVDDDFSSDNISLKHKGNILKVGALLPFDFETSFTVQTDNNLFFTFLVVYDENLTQLTYSVDDSLGIEIPKAQEGKNEVIVAENNEFEANDIDHLCQVVYSQKPIFSEIGKVYKDISVELAGIWVNDNALFFKILMANSSNIVYDISSTNLYVKERTRVRKSSTDPIQKEPFYTYGKSTIPAKSEGNVVILVFDKFTISHDKKLVLEVVEKNGGRRVEFEIVKDLIIRAPFVK